jgi:hypothetical protein
MEKKMDLDTLGTDFGIDSLTDVTLDNGFIAVEADPFEGITLDVSDFTNLVSSIAIEI